MLRSSALSAVVIIALSLAVWTWVYLSGLRALDASETMVVVGFFTAVVLIGRWFLAWRRRAPERGRLSIIAWWSIALAMAAAGTMGLFMTPVAAGTSERDQDPSVLELACTSDRPTARSEDVVALRAWHLPVPGMALRYAWTVTGGTLAVEGDSARWIFNGITPGLYGANVRVTEPARPSRECSIKVIVHGADDVLRGGPEAGFAFLVAGQHETPGYGLYSYLLLGAAPDDTTQDRYLRVLESYLIKMPSVTQLEQYFSPDQLNVTYLPVTLPPTAVPSARWLLDHYDFARARFLLRQLPGDLRRGPYFVSTLKPIDRSGHRLGEYLLQDLSTVPLHLIDSWVVAFLNQSAQERFWESSSMRKLSLKMRTIIGVLSLGLPEVRNSLKDWIGILSSVPE